MSIKKIRYFPIKFIVFILKKLIILSEIYVNSLAFIFKKNISYTSRFKMYLGKKIYEIFDDKKDVVIHISEKFKKISLIFFTPNSICKVRSDTFSSKEPELLSWIDNYGSEKPFWDIGACIGTYSIYYAKCYEAKVLAFEPSFFNLKQLAKNISINKVDDQISVVPLPLTNSIGFQKFSVSGGEEGGAANAFGVNFGGDGNEIHKKFQYKVLGTTGDHFLENNKSFGIPSLIKIDVDGIEHLILEGMKKILSSPECFSVYIEVNDNFYLQSHNISKILQECGFHLEKRFKKRAVNNQIWTK